MRGAFPTPIPASVLVLTHARINAHTRIHLMLNAPKRGGHVQAAGTGPKSRTVSLVAVAVAVAGAAAASSLTPVQWSHPDMVLGCTSGGDGLTVCA